MFLLLHSVGPDGRIHTQGVYKQTPCEKLYIQFNSYLYSATYDIIIIIHTYIYIYIYGYNVIIESRKDTAAEEQIIEATD